MAVAGRQTAASPASRVAHARTALAIVAAWLVPGCGHAMLGRVRRGAFFAVLVWGAFALGLAHEGNLALYDADRPYLSRMQIVANLGVGPADAVARMVVYGRVAYSLGPGGIARPDLQRTFRERARAAGSIYGTAYLWTAGLMNLLLLFDVWDVGRKRAGRVS